MTTGLKAIETRYNGYRFRSRLEARWAVYFDSLGIAYEYEKEGFDLDGLQYLPDFWLPVQECWIEIKPKGLETEGHDYFIGDAAPIAERARKLAMASDQRVYVCCGVPGDMEAWGDYEFVPNYVFLPDGCSDYAQWWYACRGCAKIGLSFEAKSGRTCACDWQLYDGSRLINAANAAKSARFERGENKSAAPLIRSPRVQTWLEIARARAATSVVLPEPVRPTNTVYLPGTPQRSTNV